MTEDQVLQIRVELIGIEPKIWRRILIGSQCTFWDLHVAIQDAMGWTDSHLHLFAVGDAATGRRRLIGLTMEDDELDMEPGWEHRVTEVLTTAQPRVMYEYDFGDSWEHDVVLEEILPSDGGAYPRCVAGARACPPEDVGGVPGYEDFLDAIADPRHEEHDRLLEWAGGPFEADRFDAQAVEFEDPQMRWEEVFGLSEGGVGRGVAGDRPAGAAQLEGGFTPSDLQRLLVSPFGEDSPMRLEADLSDEVLAQAPLMRATRLFLQLLADEGPLKLTAKGSLSRATVARLMETGACPSGPWMESMVVKNEADVPRATLLRALGEFMGWTRKKRGTLHLTKRGRDTLSGRTPAGEVYGTLMAKYVTEYNWAYDDAMPQSQWLQACFWYALFLLQEYGDVPRPTTFYAAKFALGFPFALQDFASVAYGSPSDVMGRAFESRVFEHFAVEFGLASVAEHEPEQFMEPRQVGAGPLLHRVVTWRRGAATVTPGPDEGTGTVVAGPWAQEAAEPLGQTADEALLACAAETPIAEVLAVFMMEQRRRLRTPQTVRKYERVVELLESYLNAAGGELLQDGDLAVFDRYAEEGPHQRPFCEVIGPEYIAPGLDGFMASLRAWRGQGELSKAAATVCKKLLAWMEQEGVLGGGGLE